MKRNEVLGNRGKDSLVDWWTSRVYWRPPIHLYPGMGILESLAMGYWFSAISTRFCLRPYHHVCFRSPLSWRAEKEGGVGAGSPKTEKYTWKGLVKPVLVREAVGL